MRSVFEKDNITWVKVSKPNRGDLKFIKNAFQFHPLVVESIETPTLHPALESYKDHLFLVLHFPIIYRDTSRNEAVEVDFLITKKILITITYTTYKRLDTFFAELVKNQYIQEQFINHHTDKLVHGIIDELMKFLVGDLDFLEGAVTGIEDKIFEEKHDSIIEEISHVRRDILDFHRITGPHQTILKLLPSAAEKFYGPEAEPYFVDLARNESKIRYLIENHKNTIEALHETHEALISNRFTKIITLLTIFSGIILPLNLIASIWGMNHAYIPLRDGKYDFWIVFAIMGFIAAALFVYLRHNRLL